MTVISCSTSGPLGGGGCAGTRSQGAGATRSCSGGADDRASKGLQLGGRYCPNRLLTGANLEPGRGGQLWDAGLHILTLSKAALQGNRQARSSALRASRLGRSPAPAAPSPRASSPWRAP